MNPYVTSMWMVITIASYIYIFKVDAQNSGAPIYTSELMDPKDWFVYPVPEWPSMSHIDMARKSMDSQLIRSLYSDQPRPGMQF